MLHHSIASRYVAQRRVYGKILRALFAITGLYWIFIYVLPSLSELEVLNLRGGQTMVYFVLLTVWGLDYLREERRLGAVINAANRLSTIPNLVTMADLGTKQTLFTMVVPPRGTPWTLWNVIFATGITAGAVLMIWQYVRLGIAVMQ